MGLIGCIKGSVAFQVGVAFLVFLYRLKKSFKFWCSSLHRFTTVCDTYSCAHCKNLSIDNDGVLFTLFTSVYDYRMCIPWWNSPSVFEVTVWSHILSLCMPCSHIALFPTYQQQTLQWNREHQVHMATMESQHNPDTGKWKKNNSTWFMAGAASSDNIHHQILDNTLSFKNFLVFFEYFVSPR